ncbi:putative RNA-binding Zn-ribbon protein involved in translation (DUF1610 family) [Bradyrhizobium elkanii]
MEVSLDPPRSSKPKRKIVCPTHGPETLNVYVRMQDVPRGGTVTVYRCSECRRLIWDD